MKMKVNHMGNWEKERKKESQPYYMGEAFPPQAEKNNPIANTFSVLRNQRGKEAMGQAFRRLLDTILGNSEMRVMMVGLDNAGKTTILYKLQTGNVVTTIPTIGFNVEEVLYKKVKFVVWDVGGRERVTSLWKHYFINMDAVIYVVDSLDRERIGTAKAEFQTVINLPYVSNCVVLVLANKQDVKGAMTPKEVSEELGLSELKERKWKIHGSCAINGDGLCDGLDWLARVVKETKNNERSSSFV